MSYLVWQSFHCGSEGSNFIVPTLPCRFLLSVSSLVVLIGFVCDVWLFYNIIVCAFSHFVIISLRLSWTQMSLPLFVWFCFYLYSYVSSAWYSTMDWSVVWDCHIFGAYPLLFCWVMCVIKETLTYEECIHIVWNINIQLIMSNV